MTESKTQTLEEMQAEIAALKEQRIQELQLAAAQRELDQLKAGKMPVETTVVDTEATVKDVKLARVRQGIAITAHVIGGPIAAGFYGAQTGHWTPALAATGVAILSLPVAIVDLGFTFAVAPPAAACVLLCTKSNEKRRKLGITMPEQADAMMARVTRF